MWRCREETMMFATLFARGKAATCILMALATAGGAKASATLPAGDTLSRIVRYDDLNLTTDAGAEAFRKRAHQAVTTMFEAGENASLADHMRVQQAKQAAWARADAQVAAAIGKARAGMAS
jgi:UrcA family protein